jgi:hypothetical protein
MSWNDPNNWQHVNPLTFTQVPGTPTPYSDVVFPSFASLPKGSPKIINFNFSYIGFPISTLVVEDSYTFEGTPVTLTDLLTIPNSITATAGPPDVTFLSTGLTLSAGVQINTANGSTLQLASPSDPTGLALDIQGPVSKTGGGQLVIDTKNITYPLLPIVVHDTPVSIQGGTVLLGASATLTGVSFQIGSGTSLALADNVAATVGMIGGSGLVDLEGTTAAGDSTSLTIDIPVTAVDQFNGLIEGTGQLALTGYGTLNTRSIDFSGTGAIQVSAGTLNVDGLISAGTLQVLANGTFGGLGSWNFAGPVVFQTGSTFDVTLNGTMPGTQYTQLQGASMSAGVDLGYGILAGSTGFQYEAGDQFTIVSAPLIKNAFQNVANGKVLLGGSIPFQVTTTGTSVTLTALQSVTSTQLTSTPNPTYAGNPVTLTATVTTRTAPATTGTVSFEQGTTVLGTVPVDSAGTASFTTTSLPVGNNTITAVYSGGAANLRSTSAPLTQSVLPFSTVTSLSTTPNPSLFGQTVTLYASVTAQGALVTTGTVSFYRGNHYFGTVPLDGNGTATLTVSSLPVGNIRIQAAYGGSTNYRPSVSQFASQSVLPATTMTSLVLTTEVLPNGATRNVLVATVAAEETSGVVPSGVVVFRRNGKVLGTAELQNGKAVLVLGRRVPLAGRYVAKFRGSPHFAASVSPPLVWASARLRR